MAVDLAARTLSLLDWPLVVEQLAAETRTAVGRRAARSLILFADVRAIEQAFDRVDDVVHLAASQAGGPPLARIADIDDALRAASRSETLDVESLFACAQTALALRDLRAFCESKRDLAPALAGIAARIVLDPALVDRLAAAFDERGRLSERTYPRLRELRRRIDALVRRARTLLEELAASPRFAGLIQDRYITERAERLVIPLKAAARSLDLGIVHDASRSGQTIFVEPHAVVAINNERRLAEVELAAEERRIVRELSGELAQHADSLSVALEAAAEIDLACARAALARRMDATRPHVGEGAVIDLRAARHPVLVLRGEQVVANDLRLDDARSVLVLTGPNAGGKTVALKTIGLCALLVRAGCFVSAAEGSRVDLVSPVLVDIGDQQAVVEGLSSFSAHLRTLRDMLDASRPGALLLLDEIAAGTDPVQGGALAVALIETFADRGARVVVTTHLAQVKAMAAADSRIALAALEYHEGRPTYRIVPGIAGESHAFEAAEQAGIDPAVLRRARGAMDESARVLQETLTALERERRTIREERLRVRQREREIEERERAVKQRERRMRLRAKELERAQAEDFLRRLRLVEDEVRATIRALQKNPTHERAREAGDLVSRARATIAHRLQEPHAEPAPGAQVGDPVRIERVGLEGEVISVDGDTVEVRAGAATVRAARHEIVVLRPRRSTRAADGAAAAQRRPPPAAADPARLAGAVRTDATTLDVRGTRVAEAERRLEAFLDRAMLEGRDVVFVIHGHGTGVLRDAVRGWLEKSPYVAAWRAGDPADGGDGVTVVALR